ncbi:2-acylglycerol O-acyltransferase 1-like [Contarinia nasturtii]|uniref:2-acylglycerol O-acyltransferase 1-like n=1 Tax=Contarinia nasturtii TaxID=265458 RepID=UPI0012D3D75A|nr:2-acylglycerol O-acyltransferase 1-like [Contarinia nasturtii]
MSIKWTPWFDVPMHRRLECLSVGLIVFCEIALGPICTFIFLLLIYIGNVYVKIICSSYLAFIYYDRHTSDQGGRGIGLHFMRNLSVWKYCLDYFPIELIKTVDLPPDRNYLFCIFPHGWLSLGAGANFATNHSKWSRLYPKIRPKCTTLGFTMLMPIQREILLNCGFSSASANSLSALLQQSNDPNHDSNNDGYTSNGVALIVGGAREAFFTHPNAYKCYIKRRKGFVKIALQSGASLVPAISYGENNMYDVVDYKLGSWVIPCNGKM